MVNKLNLSDYRESTELHKAGAPLPVGDAIFYVRRFGTPDSNAFLKELRIQLFGPLHKMQEADYDLLHAHWLADYGCTGWLGCVIDDKTGENIIYSKQAAREIFTNKGFLMSINRLLIEGACHFENYLYEDVEKDIAALKKK